MSSGSGTITPITPTPTPAATANQFAQIFCTVLDLLNDPQPPAGDVTLLFKEIQAASRTIQQEIGEFIPVSETRKVNGSTFDDISSGNDNAVSRLFIHPLLALTGSITNDGDALVGTDYVLTPREKHWRNGPYSEIDVAADAANLSAWSDELEGVVIPARWGLYEETEDTGATTSASQISSATSLQVSNGAKLSPGAVLLIGSEQELISAYDTPVSAVTTLNGTIDATQESIVVANGALLNIGEIIRIGVEQMRILDISTHTLYMQRHWNKSLGVAHTTGANIDVYRKFIVARGANGTTAASHDTSTTINRYLVPGDVLFLCKEIATLMLNKAVGSYAGRTGNQELGTVFYNDAFPRYDLERVREHYMIRTVR